MKKSIISAAIAALTIGTAVAGAPSPVGANYSGIGGAAASSSANVVGSSYNNSTPTGNGYQVSGATATNTTAATANVTPVRHGVKVQANTATNGATETWAYGDGAGTSSSLAIQGGAAKADATGSTHDYDSHRYRDHKSTASGYGTVAVDSKSATLSGAVSANNGTGFSSQAAESGAFNNTKGGVKVDADAGHKTASVDLKTGIKTEGGTYAVSSGYTSGNGVGASGGIAFQDGGGEAHAIGNISNKDGQRVTYYRPHYNHYHRHSRFIVNNSGTGYVKAESDAGTTGVSIAAGRGTHYEGAANVSGAKNKSSASIDNEITGYNYNNGTGTGMTQTTEASSESEAYEYGNSFRYNNNGVSGQRAGADADGNGKAFGTFNGQSGSSNNMVP